MPLQRGEHLQVTRLHVSLGFLTAEYRAIGFRDRCAGEAGSVELEAAAAAEAELLNDLHVEQLKEAQYHSVAVALSPLFKPRLPLLDGTKGP